MPAAVAKVVFNLPINKVFDYRIPDQMTVEPGTRVWAEFNRSKMVGLVYELSGSSSFKDLKPVLAVLDSAPLLSAEHLRFAAKLTEEYPYSLGEIIFTMVPAIFKHKRVLKELSPDLPGPCIPGRAEIICLKRPSLQGRLAWCGKKIGPALKEGSVLICFPLIAQLESGREILEKEFPGKCAVLHSAQKDKEFFFNWLELRKGKKLILGTRAALFYYPRDLGLIIVEDENHTCHFQPEKPFYHLPEAALLCARFKKIPLILSSDFPSLHTYSLIEKGEAVLDERDEDRGTVEVIAGKTFFYKKTSLSLNRLVTELVRKEIEQGKRCIVFYNRRGFSTLLKCSHCGHVYRCPRCSVPLKFSLKEDKAVCFRCNYKEEIPSLCSKCSTGFVRSFGAGIEKVKTELARAFPRSGAVLWEGRDPGSGIVLSTYSSLENGEIPDRIFDSGIVLDSDDYLSHVDYAATFKFYLLLKRLAGAVREKAMVITENGSHYLWEHINRTWKSFYSREEELRREAGLPPFACFARITMRSTAKNTLLTRAVKLYNKIAGEKDFTVFGPMEGSPFRSAGKYHYSVLVKASSKKHLRAGIKKALSGFRSGSQRIAVEIE